MLRTALLVALGSALGLTLTGASPLGAATTDEAPPYTVFHSPPARLEALLWAIVDCYPCRDLEDAKRDFLRRADGHAEPWQTGFWPDEQLLRALESEFGDMPEYWQARYFFEHVQTQRGDIGLLEKALALAPDDPATMYLLADARLRSAEYALEATNDAFADLLAKREYEREAVELMLRAAESEPPNAFYYYEAALPASRFGDYERVTELLERGNAAPLNEAVQLFPLSYMLRNLREIRAADDGTGRFRLLAFALISNPLPSFIERREMMAECQVIFSLTGETAWLNVLHNYACRYGETKYAPLIQQLVASTLVGVVFTAAADNGLIANDAETLQSVSAMGSARGAVKGLAMAHSMRYDFVRDEQHPEAALESPESVDLTPEETWEELTGAWENQTWEYLYIGEHIANQLAVLRRYHYHPDGTITRRSSAEMAEEAGG